MRKNNENIPTYRDLIVPTFKALQDLGGSGTNTEIYEKVISNMNYADDVLEESHLGSTTQTEVQYQLAWARTYLKNANYISNSGRSVWSINTLYAKTNPDELDPTRIISSIHSKNNEEYSDNNNIPEDINIENDEEEYPDENKPWRIKLSTILQEMDPYAFERLCQRVLRESGFEDVKVTRKSNDGGIDGTGKLIIQGLISFNIAFQCKRYKEKVSSVEIRNFRGSMDSNIEKGIFITTGIYTEDAKKEANASGKKQIDLVDGEKFIDILVSNKLGVEEIKYYKVHKDFFDNI